MEVKQIISQITLEALLEGHLKKGDSCRVQRDAKRRITRLGVYGVTGFDKETGQSTTGIALEYVWRPA